MLIIIIATAFLSTSCSKDDKKDTPQPVKEDPMAYMTVDFLEDNIVGVWVSDSSFNTSSTGYYNEAHVDTMWFTSTQYSSTGNTYTNFSIIKEIPTGQKIIMLSQTYLGTIEYMDKAGTQMYFKVPYPYTMPGFDKTVIRYFKQ